MGKERTQNPRKISGTNQVQIWRIFALVFALAIEASHLKFIVIFFFVLFQAFCLDDPVELKEVGVDVQLLFGNLGAVIKSSQM